ncbi:MAG: CIA30 family protein [Pricia sp.]
MKVIFLFAIAAMLHQNDSLVLFESGQDSLSGWYIQDDVVMGGVSEGHMRLNDTGNLLFSGTVRLENNGGFSSIHQRMSKKEVSDFTHVILKVKGDGKAYQFRIKSNDDERHSYVKDFETSGDWETIQLPLKDFYPVFHGETLDKPNYAGDTMTDVGILIGNGRKENFELEIERIFLK